MASSTSSQSTRQEPASKKEQHTEQGASSSSIHSTNREGKTEVLSSPEDDKLDVVDGKEETHNAIPEDDRLSVVDGKEVTHHAIEVDTWDSGESQGGKEPQVKIGRRAAILLFIGYGFLSLHFTHQERNLCSTASYPSLSDNLRFVRLLNLFSLVLNLDWLWPRSWRAWTEPSLRQLCPRSRPISKPNRKCPGLLPPIC